jgi:uncharacterized protein (DUF2384 family)
LSRLEYPEDMGQLQEPLPDAAERLVSQLEHPNANAIWTRALEVFGDEAKARSWMTSPRDIFGGQTPQDLVASGDVSAQRRVLQVLIRIDYGVFS